MADEPDSSDNEDMPRHRHLRPLSILLSVLLALGSFVGAARFAHAQDGDGAVHQPPATGSAISLPADAVVLKVDGSVPATRYYPHTSVWPDGSDENPYPDITWAVAGGQWLRKQGTAARIVIRPGIYRENIDIGWAGDAPAPLFIEPETPGTVTVSGADVEDRWTQVPGTPTFTAPWGNAWGLAAIPDGWAGIVVPDLVRRREAVFVDGQPLVQVNSAADLRPGTFTVNETAGQILMQPPAGVVDPADHLIEIAKREHALRIRGLARSVAVRDLVFERAAAPFERHMAYITDATDVLIEGNTFRQSSWGGLGFSSVTEVTVRDNASVDNGGNGIDTNRSRNIVIEANHISGNNLRGFVNGYLGWSSAGSKNLRLHDAVLRNNVYTGNHARGLWLDTDVSNVLIEGDRSTGNLGDGIFIEKVQGPLHIVGATFSDNARAGIQVGTSGNVTVESSTLADNAYAQLVFAGERTYSGLDFITGLLFEMKDFESWTLLDNTFQSTSGTPLIYSPVIPIAEWRAYLDAGEIVADGNVWRRPTEPFAIKIQATDYPLDEWRQATGDSAVYDDMTEPEVAPEEPTTSTTEPSTTEPGPTTTTTAPTTTGKGNGKGKDTGGNSGNSGKGGGKKATTTLSTADSPEPTDATVETTTASTTSTTGGDDIATRAGKRKR